MYAKSSHMPQDFTYPYQEQQRGFGSVVPRQLPERPLRLSEDTISAVEGLGRKLLPSLYEAKAEDLQLSEISK